MFTTATTRHILRSTLQNHHHHVSKRSIFTQNTTATSLKKMATKTSNSTLTAVSLAAASGIITILSLSNEHWNIQNFTSSTTTFCDARKTGGEVIMLGPTKEPSTGILFPHLCNGMQFVGCGVRVKYGFVKVYAVGTYMDPIAMSAIKTQGSKAISQALLNPAYPRTIRIVMNRSLSIDKYTAAIVEALQPRMNGQDLDKLEEFKNLNPPIDLVEGAEMEMTIRGNTMLYKNSVGGVGQIESEVFCRALCDVYYGEEAVSPGHKEQVVKGVASL